MKYIIGVIMLLMTQTSVSQVITNYVFQVEGTCGMCKQRIEKLALDNGAITADWDIPTSMLTIEIDEQKTNILMLKYMIAQGGHDNGDYITPDEEYKNLHHCCKYRDIEPSDGIIHTLEDTLEKSSVMVEGYVYLSQNGDLVPAIGATVELLLSEGGTSTDAFGYFALEPPSNKDSIRISYIGYDTAILSTSDQLIQVTLADGELIETVEITYKKKTTEISLINTINTEGITREELCKAACCNLSESFETNPAVDVAFNDAVTGTKQIQMLGLAGPYVQITRELIPDVRGMNSNYGMSTTPGPWIQNIQLIKGTGSVANGYESIAGQINVELKKPNQDERLHFNSYINNGGRKEVNLNVRTNLTQGLSTGLLIHGKNMMQAHDNNGDGFTDMPMENDFVIANRWKYGSRSGIQGQFGVKYSQSSHEGGYHDHFSEESLDHENHWRMTNETSRIDLWSKTGYIWEEKPHMSLGLQLATSVHDQSSVFGFERYKIDERTSYANLVFQNIFKNGHILRTGISYQQDKIEELVDKAGIYDRHESVPGAYAEYTIKQGDVWTIIPGIRIDHHSNFGTFVTPRLHAKYNISDQSIVRLSAGRGQKTASIFAENMSVFASQRVVNIQGSNPDTPYGLEAETAWNYGVNYTQAWRIVEREMILAIDLYRTHFENQIIADFETPGKVDFYNLEGGVSFANSFQAKIDYELIENFDIRVAYRLFDVQREYREGIQEVPFISKHRAFVNMAYATKSNWHFDMTFNWRGAKRLPSTVDNPRIHQRPAYSPDYILINGQISKRWSTVLDIYVGSENILDFKQSDAIIDSENAFGPYFDASIIWAPLFGRNIYLGVRYNLSMKKS